MKHKYQNWIDIKLQVASPIGQCAEWTTEMQEAFPELKRVRGHVLLGNGMEREHWWLVDYDEPSDPVVVDPTRRQFLEYLGARPVRYTPRDETQPEPTGKCPNCGEYCYTGSTCCSDACHRSYVAYCSNPN